MASSSSRDDDVASEPLSNELLPVAGVRLASAASGARYSGRDDLTLIELAPGAAFACLYTTNKFCAAPVTVAKRHQHTRPPRYLVINAGNANAGTGDAGISAALEVCGEVARAAGCGVEEVLPYSTGVIGQQLSTKHLNACIPQLLEQLALDAWPQAAAAILTTDTRAKAHSLRVDCGAHSFTVTGMTKGSGMIKPNMATMLAYVATDAAISPALLADMATRAAEVSFNRITVDGDTSTNDAFALIASGAAGNAPVNAASDDRHDRIYRAIETVCIALAKDIIRDGEGATKFVTVTVNGGQDAEDCRRVAYAVAESPLVKTALFASDPNWGRILAAIGRAGAAHLDIDAVSIDIGGCAIVRRGQPAADYDEKVAAQLMRETDIEINIGIGAGPAATQVWTCDFSYAYVKINAEYRS